MKTVTKYENGISILVPCYNSGEYLVETVKCLLAQGFEEAPFEIIVVDDASTDPATKVLVDQISDLSPLISVVKNPVNLGLAGARNQAIKCARYAYSIPIDSDDLLTLPKDGLGKGYLQDGYAKMNQSTDVVIAYCASTYFGSKSGPVGLEVYSEDLILVKNMIPAYGMFRTEEAISVGGYHETFRGLEDWFMWISLLNNRVSSNHKAEVAFINKHYHLYRQYPDQSSLTNTHGVTLKQFYAEAMARNPSIYKKYPLTQLRLLYNMLYVKIPARYKGTGLIGKLKSGWAKQSSKRF